MNYYIRSMNSKLFLLAVVVVSAFGVTAAVVGPVTMAPALAQNMTEGGNMTGMGGNLTGGNMTAGNITG
jgi:predicted chitinase